MVLPCAIGAITPIIPTLARPTVTTDLLGLTVASSSARVPGMAGAIGMDLVDTAIAADTAAGTAIAADTAAGTQVDIVADTLVDIAVDSLVAREVQSLPGDLAAAVDIVADTQVADTQPAVVDSAAAWAAVAGSTVVAAAAPMVEAADTGKV